MTCGVETRNYCNRGNPKALISRPVKSLAQYLFSFIEIDFMTLLRVSYLFLLFIKINFNMKNKSNITKENKRYKKNFKLIKK